MQKGGDCLVKHAGVHTTGMAMVVSWMDLDTLLSTSSVVVCCITHLVVGCAHT